ncbi:MAG: hypothetical protein KC635_23645 [Myxococcales bacterium]|nr:hypothetical protein [Myxococcales bacterium]
MQRDEVPIAECDERWDAMAGDEATRSCARCVRRVHNLSALSEPEARAFVARALAMPEAIRPCVTLRARAGLVEFAPAPAPPAPWRRWAAAGVTAVGLSLGAGACAPDEGGPSPVAEVAAPAQLAVRVRPETARVEVDGVLVEGGVAGPFAPGSRHRVEVSAPWFRPEVREVTLEGGLVTTLSIVLDVAPPTEEPADVATSRGGADDVAVPVGKLVDRPGRFPAETRSNPYAGGKGHPY